MNVTFNYLTKYSCINKLSFKSDNSDITKTDLNTLLDSSNKKELTKRVVDKSSGDILIMSLFENKGIVKKKMIISTKDESIKIEDIVYKSDETIKRLK
jgi:hypothetical protein